VSRIRRAAVVAVLLLGVFELGVRALAPALPQTTTWREPMVAAKVARMDELSRGAPIDVVLAGTSQMLFAGDPKMLRSRLGAPWSVYNAALWGAPPVVNEHWLTKVVAPRLRPRTVVLGVSPLDFVEADSDAAADRYFASTSVRGDWLATVERSVSRVSALVRERRSLRDPTTIVDSVGRRFTGEAGRKLAVGQVDASGRAPRRDAARFQDTPLARKMVAGVVRRGWTVSERQRLAFRRTLTTLRETGAEVIVVDMAISGPLIDRLGPRAYAEFHSFLRKEAAAAHVQVLDIARGFTSTTFFFDFDHVNRAGADVFNTVLWRALGKGQPGGFTRAIAPDVATKPLAPTLANDVIAREEVRAAARAGSKPSVGGTPNAPSVRPKTPTAEEPTVPSAPTPSAPAPNEPRVPAPPLP
jgi:hypothetical protein